MRQPQYTTDRAFHIVSVPGNQWRLQRHSGQPSTRESDPWVNQSHPISLAAAESLLRTAQPAKKAVA